MRLFLKKHWPTIIILSVFAFFAAHAAFNFAKTSFPGYREELIAADFFGDYHLSIPMRLFKAHHYEGGPYPWYLRNKETITYTFTSLSRLNQKIQDRQEEFLFNGKASDFALQAMETERAVYYRIERAGKVSCFCLLDVKGESHSRYLRFFNMALRLRSREEVGERSAEDGFAAALLFPFHLIDDPRLISDIEAIGGTGEGYLDEKYSAAVGREQFEAFYRDAGIYLVEPLEDGPAGGFTLSSAAEREAYLPEPLAIRFFEAEDGAWEFSVGLAKP